MSVTLPPNRLRELADRDDRRLSVIAAHCDVDQSTVHRWREGKSAIPDTQKLRLADFFGVSVSFLMGWDGAHDGESNQEISDADEARRQGENA